MKKVKPTKQNVTSLHQLCKLIPGHLTRKISQKHGVDKKCRSFSEWSHVVCLLFSQLTHCISLNDLCDSLRHHASKLGAIRGATPPSKNGLSNANKVRDSNMMEDLFWEVLKHLQSISPQFGPYGKYSGFPSRFRKTIHAVDSSTIALVANCMPWAKHRRRKAAAKMHMRLNLQTFLPSFAVIEEASHHDDTRTLQLCANMQEGEIVVFDKAYVNFSNLHILDSKGIYWVTRAKDNMRYKVYRKNIRTRKGSIIRDDLVHLTMKNTRKQYSKSFRRVEAEVQIDGKPKIMVFITNNIEWAASSVCDLYKSRWGIEVFFKQIKQTLQLSDFLGHNKHAIRWQLWSALLLYVLLKFYAFQSKWFHSFSRLLTLIRGIVWDRFNLLEILEFYGTARSKYRMCCHPEISYLPGFEPKT